VWVQATASLRERADWRLDQLPAICTSGVTRGITFVVSPLISLINDQTRHLIKLNIPAIAYTGDMTSADKQEANEQLSLAEPWTKVCYVTPEMLSMGGAIKGILRGLVRRKRLARFVIDEAHCVSQVSVMVANLDNG
jgi:bloom syndrome protein